MESKRFFFFVAHMLLKYSEMRNLHAHFYVNLGNHRDNVSGSRSLKKAMFAERFWGVKQCWSGLGDNAKTWNLVKL